MVMPRTPIVVCLAVTASLLVVVVACRSAPDQRAPAAPSPQTSPGAGTLPAGEPSPPPALPDAAEPVVQPPEAPALATKPEPAACAPRTQPAKCPATEPNVNRPCSPKGIECTYAPGCCPPVYVCNKKGRFEAHFTRC